MKAKVGKYRIWMANEPGHEENIRDVVCFAKISEPVRVYQDKSLVVYDCEVHDRIFQFYLKQLKFVLGWERLS